MMALWENVSIHKDLTLQNVHLKGDSRIRTSDLHRLREKFHLFSPSYVLHSWEPAVLLGKLGDKEEPNYYNRGKYPYTCPNQPFL